jgi:hypothetical protein
VEKRKHGRPRLETKINMEITANVVTVDDGPPVVIGFADAPSNPSNYILLSYDPSEKDEGLYIELNDQIRGGYNLVQRIRLTDSAMFIELNSAGSQALKAGGEIKVVPSAQATKWPSFKSKVMQLLSDVVPVG